MMFDISGAVVSRLAAGDRGFEVVMPFVIAALVGLSWALRPLDRRLVAGGLKPSAPGLGGML
jgi:hypothetical protein